MIAEIQMAAWPQRAHWIGSVRVFFLALLIAGCASHSANLREVTADLQKGEPKAARNRFLNDQKQKSDDLLYLLERGYLEHVASNYDSSNIVFDAAELRSEELYTHSISNEALALVTSENVKPYRSYPYELVMIHYYRAFNYLEMGNLQGALVEARKANQRLSNLEDKEGGGSRYSNDAFMQYFTGLLYEAAGEYNDALVSYRAAAAFFGTYQSEFGVEPPSFLVSDLHRALLRAGMSDEARLLVERHGKIPEPIAREDEATVVLFVESGLIPHREPVDITLPIFNEKNDKYEDCDDCALEYATVLTRRHRDNIYSYRGRKLELDHVLRFSFPELVDYPSQIAAIEVNAPEGGGVTMAEAQPLGKIAHRDFNQRLPNVLLKTLARALAKEFARTRVKKKDETLGALVNIFNVATEQADTRGWIFLPDQIDIAKVAVPPGKSDIEVVFRGADNQPVDRRVTTVEATAGEIKFRRVRSYR